MGVPNSITQLRNVREAVRTARKAVNPSDYDGQAFGPESEYDARGILAGIDSVTTDLAALTKAPRLFTQQSSHGERNNLLSHFQKLEQALSNEDLSSAAQHLENIKPPLRNIGIRYRSERQAELINQINDLQRAKSETEDLLNSLITTEGAASQKVDEIEAKHFTLLDTANAIESTQKEAQEALAKANTTFEEITATRTQAAQTEEKLQSLLNSATSHEEVITGFSQRVTEREKQLDAQQARSDQFEESLASIEQRHAELTNEAETLIAEAKTALEYKTAEGLSAAFQEKYLEAKHPLLTLSWIAGALIFTATGIGIGVWIFADGNNGLPSIIGRLSLIPILIAAAWFCANQYTKQKHLAEDYAYKSVLTKSLVGFSDQLSDDTDKGDEYKAYIRTVLAEIHQDPLRKRRGEQNPATSEAPETVVDRIASKVARNLSANTE